MQTDSIGFIYEWTNTINGRKYIGKHKGTVDDGYIGNGKYFLKAFKKYGKDKFTRRILEFVSGTENDLNQCEEKWLAETNAAKDPGYYNISNCSSGGCTTAGYSKEYISAYMKAITSTPEWKLKRKINHTKALSTKEWKEALLIGIKNKGDYSGCRNSHFKGYWVTPIGKYDSQVSAAAANNITFQTIRNRCLRSDHIIKQTNLPKSWRGKTWRELGWGFEPRTTKYVKKKRKYRLPKNYAAIADRNSIASVSSSEEQSSHLK